MKKNEAEKWKYGYCQDDSVRHTNNGCCMLPATSKDGLSTFHRNRWIAQEKRMKEKNA